MVEHADTTIDHTGPLRPARAQHASALLVAFPVPHLLPVPRSGRPLGRHWLHSSGIDDRKVSGEHLRFRHDGKLYVSDVGSRNGTFINGARLASGVERPLHDGDVLRMGRTLAVYSTAADAHMPRPPLGAMVAPFGLEGVRRTLAALQQNPARNILIEGETGTGKELAARAVAQLLGRDEPYIVVNMASVPSGVFEAQLFGHTAGAFSDAKAASPGLIVAHQGGAVCLDEMGELPLPMQPKLLRLLENREVQPVGATRAVEVDVLLIATTNRDLRQLAIEGRFRLDLVARMARARLVLPPLRERPADIFHIARSLPGSQLDPELVEVEAAEQLLLQSWPTNVRGVAAVLAETRALDPEPGLRAWALSRVLDGHHEASQASEASSARPSLRSPSSRSAGPASEPLTETRVQNALAACGGNETQAAKHLGVSRGKLRRFLAKR